MTVDVLTTQFQAAGVQNVIGAFKGISLAAKETDKSLKEVAGFGLGAIATAAGIAAGATVFMAATAVKAAADMQMLEKRIDSAFKGATTTINGATVSAMEFAKAMNRMTPFELPQVADLMVRMQALGLDPFRNLQTMVDTAAGLGSTETALNVSRQLGQMLAKDRVLMEDLSILAENGVPIFRYLKEELGLTAEQLAKIGESGIDAKSTVNAILNALDREHSGKAAAAMKTFTGSVSNLKDSWNELKAAMGSDFLDPLAAGVRVLSLALDGLRDSMKWIKIAVDGALSALTPFMGLIAPILKFVGIDFNAIALAKTTMAAHADRSTTPEAKSGNPFAGMPALKDTWRYQDNAGKSNGISKLADLAAMALGGGKGSETDAIVQQFIRGGGERLSRGVGGLELPRSLGGKGKPVIDVKVSTNDNSPIGKAIKDLMERFGVDLLSRALSDPSIRRQIQATAR